MHKINIYTICFLIQQASILYSAEIRTQSLSSMQENRSLNNTRRLELETSLKTYERISNSPVIFLSMLSAFVHGFLFVALPVVIFALNKQKTVNLIKSKAANLDKI